MLTLLAALLLFAATIVVQKFVLLAGVPINAFLALRMLAPGFVLTAFEVFHGRHKELGRIFKPIYMVLACITTLAPLFLKNLAHQKMSSAKFSLIGSMDPFLTCALAFLIFGQKVSRRQYFGIVVASLGILILTNHKIALEPMDKVFLHFSWPEVCALIAVILGRLGWMANQNLMSTRHFSQVQTNIMFMGIPGVLAAVLATSSGQASQFLATTTPATWLAVTASITLNTFACLLMTKSLQKFSSITVSLAGTCIIPIAVSLASLPVHGEPLSRALAFAGLFIFSGLVIFNFEAKKLAQIIWPEEPEVE